MKVKNISGTSDNSCKCGSWLEHWERHSGQTLPAHCVEATCLRVPTIGAHVQTDNSTDTNWYIIPLCDKHNAKISALTISDGAKLVPANVSETCGKATKAAIRWT